MLVLYYFFPGEAKEKTVNKMLLPEEERISFQSILSQREGLWSLEGRAVEFRGKGCGV